MVEEKNLFSNPNIYKLLMKDLAKFKTIADYILLNNI
jgi:hypothetical protein